MAVTRVNKELRRDMTPAEKTAKRVGRITREQVERPLSEAAGHCDAASLTFTVTSPRW